jgi:hypothetical protein
LGNLILYKEYFKSNEDNFDKDLINIICNDLEKIYANPKDQMSFIKKNITKIFSDRGFITNIRINNKFNLTINGVKEQTALSIQFGNISRFYADLIKLEYMFKNELIKNVIYLCPTKVFEKKSNSGNLCVFERCLKEINLFTEIISVPIIFIGIESD